MMVAWRPAAMALVLGASGCGGHSSTPTPPAPATAGAAPTPRAQPVVAAAPAATAVSIPTAPPQPALPPAIARLAGLLPLRSIGADTFRARHPTADGRGTLIGILDTGVDPGLPGLATTTTGDPKIVDVRDFSGEGRLTLLPVTVRDGAVMIGNHLVTGLGRVTRLATPPFFGALFRELPLGSPPASDVNGNGSGSDEFPVVVARASDGWFIMTDTDGDGSLDDERPIRDFAIARDTFTYRTPDVRGPGPLTIAANIVSDSNPPVVDFVFDNMGHGTHVAGIAAGHDLFGVAGFDGVAPGAQILALKVSNDARGGITMTGAVLRAMNYAADYAASRGLPLVINLSFGVGNIAPGSAAIDTIVNEFALKHADVPFVTSAGNGGPGLSTVSFPGSADHATTVCALYPGVFARLPEPGARAAPDQLGWWSARGGEVAKPDVCAPGVAYSNVPRWHTGGEVSSGTSMAAPQISGAMSLLQSAMAQEGRRVRAAELRLALVATAAPLEGASVVDQGRGIANVGAAYRWLQAVHQSGFFEIRALDAAGDATRGSAAYRRSGLQSPGDTVQRFRVASVEGQPAAKITFTSDAGWIRAPDTLTLRGQAEVVTLRYDAAGLTAPGVHVGTVWARSVTDTLAGPLFALTNTVVVPVGLDAPWQTRGVAPAGHAVSYFLQVPAGAGGLHVALKLAYPDQRATLYLFAPTGQPAPERGSVDVGRESPAAASLEVRADDLRPGVWEAVVVAPPGARASYEVSAALPGVSFKEGAGGSVGGAVLHNAGGAALTANVTARLVGAERTAKVTGHGGEAVTVTTQVPAWASRLVVDVETPAAIWNQITDFGVTVFDQDGVQLSQGPLDYAWGRQQVPLGAGHAGHAVTVELMPAFAHLDPPAQWTATVRLTYRTATERAALVNGLTDTALVMLGAGGDATVSVAADSAFTPPAGFQSTIELRAASPTGPAAIRWLLAGGAR
jgi:subtilisin family serine protease